MAGLVTISAYYNDVQLTGVRCVGRWRNGNIDLVSCGASQVMNGAEKSLVIAVKYLPPHFPSPFPPALAAAAGHPMQPADFGHLVWSQGSRLRRLSARFFALLAFPTSDVEIIFSVLIVLRQETFPPTFSPNYHSRGKFPQVEGNSLKSREIPPVLTVPYLFPQL